MNEITKSLILTPFNLLYKISPKFELQMLFRLKTKRKLNFDNPKSFNEKLNYLKLYDTKIANELKPVLCDKYRVREYVEKLAGRQILNELYWEGFDPKDIPYDKLPNQFVIKVTHGSTFNIIVKDKNTLNRNKVEKKLHTWLKAKFIPCYGEWWYGKVRPRIIIEKYLENHDKGELIDYKVFCFHGVPKLIDVHAGRFGNHTRNLYDVKWNFYKDARIKYPQGEVMSKPNQLKELLKYAEILSKDFKHVRIDFFMVDEKIYFGEFTFANGAGFDAITPYEFDLEMGSWLNV